jgi:uncharacterized protein
MPMNSKERLIVFTRYPEPGKTKTRLIPRLGPDGAADLHRKMTEHTILQVKKLLYHHQFDAEIHYDGADNNRMKDWLGTVFSYLPQERGDLGYRMKQCLENAFASGAERAVIIGTDIPDITPTTILKAFNSLKHKSMVLGPATDGGYYLIGFQKDAFYRPISHLFTNIQWGKSDVLNKTIGLALGLGIDVSLLEALEDVDRPENLAAWERKNYSTSPGDKPTRISIIIPALNEADNLKQTIASIGRLDNKEIILADGGSLDETVHIAKSFNLDIVNSSPPKAKQMNEGATRASGDILLFLHADTRLPINFETPVCQCLTQTDVIAGAFELSINADVPALKLIERLANWRSHRLNLPYGDQAIFVRSDIFHQLEGFPEIPIMEDFEFIRQLGKKGDIVTLPLPVVTSSRRWKNRGVLRTTLINQIAIAMFYAKVPPKIIARWYGRSKGLSK